LNPKTGMHRTVRTGQSLYRRAKEVIPGGTQLLSKRPEMFAPDIWPAYYAKAKGAYVWDLDSNRLLDMSIMSVGACTLGYADDDVDNAVIEAIRRGVTSSLNCPEEVHLADKLIDLHPWFQMVRYTKSGGEAISVAVRIARAATGRDVILFSGYHGWSDWYLAANLTDDKALDGQLMPGLLPSGVPRALRETAFPFKMDDVQMLENLFTEYEGKVAAVIVEPSRGALPDDQVLSRIKDLCTRNGTVLIFDEVTSGFRICVGCCHRTLETKPDLAILAKGMSNGYPLACVIGVRSVMEAAQSTFISSTNWTERTGLVAALATINKYESLNVANYLNDIGRKVQGIWSKKAADHDLPILVTGVPSLAAFSFGTQNSGVLATRFCVSMLDRGVLAFRQFKASYAHSETELDIYDAAVDEVFGELSRTRNLVPDFESAHLGFHRLTAE
jgi:glutamate-1-semialdehyde 2,1-aminomutase